MTNRLRLSIHAGFPWWTLPLIGSVVGLVAGTVIALPAIRLDGFYYALLTLGEVLEDVTAGRSAVNCFDGV